MERFVAVADAPVPAALDALATRMDLGLVLADPAGRPIFGNRTALDLLGCDGAASFSECWAALQSVKVEGPAGDEGAKGFIADLASGGGIRYLRGESRSMAGGLEVFLKDRRSLGELDIELLCASRMREWIHQCDALVHDANGALNTIQLTLELLDGQWPGPKAGEQVREPHRRNHVDVIRDNLEKLKGTLRQLSAAHDAGTASAVFDLRDVVKETATTLRMPARRRRIDLQARTGDTMLPVKGNYARIRQALVNVALGRLESLSERSVLVLEANASADGLEIVCKDDGTLTEAAKAGIYHVFLAEAGAGSGSDFLRLARAIVECEAGEFQIRREPGAATVFRLLFPRAAS